MQIKLATNQFMTPENFVPTAHSDIVNLARLLQPLFQRIKELEDKVEVLENV